MRSIIALPDDVSIEILDPEDGQDEEGNIAWQGIIRRLNENDKSISLPHQDVVSLTSALLAMLHQAIPEVSWSQEVDERVSVELIRLCALYNIRLNTERRTWQLYIELNSERLDDIPQQALALLRDAGFTVHIKTH